MADPTEEIKELLSKYELRPHTGSLLTPVRHRAEPPVGSNAERSRPSTERASATAPAAQTKPREAPQPSGTGDLLARVAKIDSPPSGLPFWVRVTSPFAAALYDVMKASGGFSQAKALLGLNSETDADPDGEISFPGYVPPVVGLVHLSTGIPETENRVGILDDWETFSVALGPATLRDVKKGQPTLLVNESHRLTVVTESDGHDAVVATPIGQDSRAPRYLRDLTSAELDGTCERLTRELSSLTDRASVEEGMREVIRVAFNAALGFEPTGELNDAAKLISLFVRTVVESEPNGVTTFIATGDRAATVRALHDKTGAVLNMVELAAEVLCKVHGAVVRTAGLRGMLHDLGWRTTGSGSSRVDVPTDVVAWRARGSKTAIKYVDNKLLCLAGEEIADIGVLKPNRGAWIPEKRFDLFGGQVWFKPGGVHNVAGKSGTGKTELVSSIIREYKRHKDELTVVYVRCGEPLDRFASPEEASARFGLPTAVWTTPSVYPSVIAALQETALERYEGEIFLVVESATDILQMRFGENLGGGAASEGVSPTARKGLAALSEMTHPRLTTFLVLNTVGRQSEETYWPQIHGAGSVSFFIERKGSANMLTQFRDRLDAAFLTPSITLNSDSSRGTVFGGSRSLTGRIYE